MTIATAGSMGVAVKMVTGDHAAIAKETAYLLALLNDAPIVTIAYDNVRYSNLPEKWDMLRPLIYLKLSVAGHMTIFVTRTRGPLWSIRPSWILLLATFSTQTVATFIVVYGFLMTPIGWSLALMGWGYALQPLS